MSTHADNSAPDDRPKSRVKPHQLAIGLGVGVALFTIVSGILPQITDWHNDNAVHRVVLVNNTGTLQVALYTVIPVMIVWGSIAFAHRMKKRER
ncbi:MAG: iron-sulfur protein, partial [Acidimicrobiia bacterium]|nr:iron-sulfur protein [Acidimicrobiia bacterium]